MQKGERRLQNFEFVIPVVVGTAAYYLGKKVLQLELRFHPRPPLVIFSFTRSCVQATEYHSHRWTLYVRSVNGEDLTHLLSKVRFHRLCTTENKFYGYISDQIMQVVFQLHPSFDNPMREYTHPPYELTETGWGEFEIAALVRRLVPKWHMDVPEVLLTCLRCCFRSCTSQTMPVRNL